MTVYRPDPLVYTDVEVEIPRKPGKGLGLGLMARTPGPGVYISDLVGFIFNSTNLFLIFVNNA